MRWPKCLLMAIVFLGYSPSVYGATIQAATCARADVARAVTAAVDGDTVMVPAGTCTWTTSLTINGKILTLQGAGIGQTVIVDGTTNPDLNDTRVLIWITKDGGLTRLTGFTWQGGGAADTFNKGMLKIQGSSHQLRIDHNRFVPTTTAAYLLYGYLWGVIDHNIIDVSTLGVPSGGSVGSYVHNGSQWNVPGSDFGDASWADITDLGTNRAMFVEDNLF